MNLDYRLFWLFFMLFIPFCSNRYNDVESSDYVCASINSPELTGKVVALRLILDSAIIRAETKQQAPATKLQILSGLEAIHKLKREKPPE